MQRLRGYFIKLGCGLGLCLVAWPAQAQHKLPAPVAPPTIGALPAPIQPTQPQTALPAPISAHSAPATNPVPIVRSPPSITVVAPIAPDAAAKTAALTVPLLITQWRAGKAIPQEAWDKGALTVEDLIYILNHSIDYWGGFYWEKDVDLRRAIVALLVQHGDEKIAKPETLSPFVRLWLADYYESIGDERTLPLCEGILSEIKTPVKGENALVFQAIERIAWYYRDTGKLNKAVETWLRMKRFHTDAGWWMPDAYLEAARLSFRMGDHRKAGELYDQVAKFGNDWFTDGAFYEYASQLISIEDWHGIEQALDYSPNLSYVQPIEKRVMTSTLLGYLAYHNKDWSKTRQFCQEAITQYKLVSDTRQRSDLRRVIDKDQMLLHMVKQWEISEIVLDPPEVNIIGGHSKKDNPIQRLILVNTLQAVPLIVTSSSPKIKIRIENSPWADDSKPLQFQQAILVEIAPEALQENLEANVIVSSLKIPNFQATVPLHITVIDQK